MQIWTDFHENEAKKYQNGRFFKMAVFQNRQFSKFILKSFKILQICSNLLKIHKNERQQLSPDFC